MKAHGQREFMRQLVESLGRDEYEVCAAYAEAERDGQVKRARNATGKSPDEYAAALGETPNRKGGCEIGLGTTTLPAH